MQILLNVICVNYCFKNYIKIFKLRDVKVELWLKYFYAVCIMDRFLNKDKVFAN